VPAVSLFLSQDGTLAKTRALKARNTSAPRRCVPSITHDLLLARHQQLRPCQVHCHGSLSVLHEGPEGSWSLGLLKDPQRHALAWKTRLHLLWEAVQQGKACRSNRFVDVMSTTPAKIFGMYGKKGTLAVGADADVVVWDPKKELTLGLKDHAHARGLQPV